MNTREDTHTPSVQNRAPRRRTKASSYWIHTVCMFRRRALIDKFDRGRKCFRLLFNSLRSRSATSSQHVTSGPIRTIAKRQSERLLSPEMGFSERIFKILENNGGVTHRFLDLRISVIHATS